MNLRAILLKKTTLLHKDQFAEMLQLGKLALKPWVTMGHFDAIYSYRLDTENRNIFAVIHENNSIVTAMNDENTYYHPLYLLTDLDDTNFWEQDSWFLAVTRIHLASTVTDFNEIEDLRQYIFAQCNTAGCSCVIYQTIELSDLTMVVKSDRISNMLSIILNLWSHSKIGKLYTYCGIDYGHLKDLDMQPAEDDTIDFLSIRFAVRMPKNANQFFHVVKEELGADPIYSIAGVDDAVLNFSSLPVQKLISFFRRWFVAGLPESINSKQIFSDITTRLGAIYRNSDSDEESQQQQPPHQEKEGTTPPAPRSLDQSCDELVTLSSKVLKLDSPIDKYWLRSFSELSYSLLRLSKAAPLDEFVYLMLPGIKSFLCNMDDILSNGGQDCAAYLDKDGLCQFVDNWSHLMEHVMRLEGQLVHNPETRPILYDIPMAMLEYTMAFLDLCSQILQKKDSPKKNIQFILFPKLCNIIETEEMFVADYRLPGLLSISIPFHMMYDPQTIQITLCHEIAHFVGESHRNRPLRRKCYIHASAILIANLVFKTKNKIFIGRVHKKLTEYVISCSTTLHTISDFEATVQQWVDDLLYDDTSAKYCSLIRDVLEKTASDRKCQRLEICADFTELIERNKILFAEVLPKLTMLFREVFADICMMYLLNLDANTYLNALYDGVVENPDSIEFTAVRVFTTLSAVGKYIPEQINRFDNELSNRFFCSIQRLTANDPNLDIDSEIYQIPIGCVRQLQKYSDKCAADIRALLEDDDEIEEMVGKLQKMYLNVMSTDMNYALLWEFINDYRKKCLGSNS